MLRFEPLELVQQPVELFVGDLRVVVDVVALFVMADRVTQLAEALFRCVAAINPAGLKAALHCTTCHMSLFFFTPTPGNRAGREAASQQLAAISSNAR